MNHDVQYNTDANKESCTYMLDCCSVTNMYKEEPKEFDAACNTTPLILTALIVREGNLQKILRVCTTSFNNNWPGGRRGSKEFLNHNNACMQ